MFEGDQTHKYPRVTEIMEELKHIMDIAFPIAAINLVCYLKSVVSVACMGKLGQLELAGGSLAIGFTNITGYSVLSGLAMGMDPLCSQAFGSKNFSLLTLTLQRTILLLLFASLPISFLWLNLEPSMLKINQNADIARVAGLYCRFALPDLIANSILHPLRIYLRNKGSIKPLMWCTSLAVLIHLPLTSFLALTLHLGVPGIAVASFCTNFNTLLFVMCYMLNRRARDHGASSLSSPPLPPPTTTIATTITTTEGILCTSMGEEWSTLLRLAFPSCLGVCLEWWWYELMTLLAGYLTNPRATLATSAIVIQTTSLMYTLPMAISASASTRVGNELGAGRPEKARITTMVAMALSVLVSVIGLMWTMFGRGVWGRIFTNDQETLKLTAAVLPIIGLCELANCPQTTGCGVLRGAARPSVGAAINLYSFYLVGAPVALALAFLFKLGFVGLCYGLLAAQITCALSITAVILRTDWDRESLKAMVMVGRGGFVYHNQAQKSGEETEFLKQVASQA